MQIETKPQIQMAKVEALYGNSIFHVMAESLRDLTTRSLRPFRNVGPVGAGILAAGVFQTAIKASQGESSVAGPAEIVLGTYLIARDITSAQNPRSLSHYK